MPVIRRKAVPPVVIPEPQTSRLLRIPQVAAYLSCSVWFVRYLISHGELPHLVAGKHFVVDRADVDAYIARNKVAA